jgi:hypothetical protein
MNEPRDADVLEFDARELTDAEVEAFLTEWNAAKQKRHEFMNEPRDTDNEEPSAEDENVDYNGVEIEEQPEAMPDPSDDPRHGGE